MTYHITLTDITSSSEIAPYFGTQLGVEHPGFVIAKNIVTNQVASVAFILAGVSQMQFVVRAPNSTRGRQRATSVRRAHSAREHETHGVSHAGAEP